VLGALQHYTSTPRAQRKHTARSSQTTLHPALACWYTQCRHTRKSPPHDMRVHAGSAPQRVCTRQVLRCCSSLLNACRPASSPSSGGACGCVCWAQQRAGTSKAVWQCVVCAGRRHRRQ
jgi:hypothetical protein